MSFYWFKQKEIKNFLYPATKKWRGIVIPSEQFWESIRLSAHTIGVKEVGTVVYSDIGAKSV